MPVLSIVRPRSAALSRDEPAAIPRASATDHPYHVPRYNVGVAKAISVRLDDEALKALRRLEAAGMSRSDAIRFALLSAAGRLRRRGELAAEVAGLEADEHDRQEMLEVAGLMETLRVAG